MVFRESLTKLAREALGMAPHYPHVHDSQKDVHIKSKSDICCLK